MSESASRFKAFSQKLASIHPLLLLPVVGGAAWLAAGLLPGLGNAPAQADSNARAGQGRAAQHLADINLPAQMPTTLFAAAPAAAYGAAAGVVAGASSAGSAGGPGASSGDGGAGSGSGKPKYAGRSVSADTPRHLRADRGPRSAARTVSIQRMSRAPAQQQPRVAYVAPVQRSMPAPPVASARPFIPYGGGYHFAGGGYHGGGHAGGRR